MVFLFGSYCITDHKLIHHQKGARAGLASWNAQASANGGAQLLFTLVLTGSLISILPLIVAFLFLQRYWQGGLTLGSIRS
jgi:ABC-type glycerol-3-phosphate transport system permease component